MFKVIFHASSVDKKARQKQKSLQMLDAVKSGLVTVPEPVHNNAYQMSKKFEEDLRDSCFVVAKRQSVDLDGNFKGAVALSVVALRCCMMI